MKYSKFLIINLIVSYILSAIMTIVMKSAGFFDNNIIDTLIEKVISSEIEALIFFLVIGFLCFLLINLTYFPIHLIKIFLITKNIVNEKYVDTKKSIYTRDLPEYNSAIAGELLDFKTTFKEEYMAGVIELISKGYIIEKENEIIVDKLKSTEDLNYPYVIVTENEIEK